MRDISMAEGIRLGAKSDSGENLIMAQERILLGNNPITTKKNPIWAKESDAGKMNLIREENLIRKRSRIGKKDLLVGKESD